MEFFYIYMYGHFIYFYDGDLCMFAFALFPVFGFAAWVGVYPCNKHLSVFCYGSSPGSSVLISAL